MPIPIYDRIGVGYATLRQPDARIVAAVTTALGDAESVLNVGAGTGSYEPADRAVTAVEPSRVMIDQRPPSAAPVVQASAEALPFAENSFDAVMAVISDHHWTERHQGLCEMRRVARRRVVVLNVDPASTDDFWLNREYLPEFVDLIPARFRQAGAWRQSFARAWGDVSLQPVPIPGDCTDGFHPAYWRRPHAYLDPAVRACISVFALLPAAAVTRAMQQLAPDLDSGAWSVRHAELLQLGELDLGLRIVSSELR